MKACTWAKTGSYIPTHFTAMCLSGVVVFTATSRAVSVLEIKYVFKYRTFKRAASAETEGGGGGGGNIRIWFDR